MHIYKSNEPFTLECGTILPGITIAYHTFGVLNTERSNCIWVCHALTANSDVQDWWPHTVEKDRFLDPEKNFIVCANIVGSCYGSTGPLSLNPATGSPWYDSFPPLTIRDMVNAHRLLADYLGLSRISMLVGSSVGGFQALEWAVEEPHRFESIVLIATEAYASPWTVAADEAQRMAILADASYGERRPDAGAKGLAAARAIAMLTYRGAKGYNLTQKDAPRVLSNLWDLRRSVTYQRHQGRKLVDRFDAYSYVTILNAFDTHDIGRDRGGIASALQLLDMPVLVVGITTDIIFTPDEMKRLASLIPRGVYCEIESDFGHDGFLVEHEALNRLIMNFREKTKTEI